MRLLERCLHARKEKSQTRDSRAIHASQEWWFEYNLVVFAALLAFNRNSTETDQVQRQLHLSCINFLEELQWHQLVVSCIILDWKQYKPFCWKEQQLFESAFHNVHIHPTDGKIVYFSCLIFVKILPYLEKK